MAIEIKTDEGAVIKFDTVEEYREFMVINGKLGESISEEIVDVDMENLPIGTLVKVVDNNAGHCHEVGEILPIAEIAEGVVLTPYRLDGRTTGWVAVKDVEFVSFPEEEESTSGDEGFEADEEDADKPEPKFEVGDTVKVLRNITGGFDAGTIGKVVGIMPWGSLEIESDCGGPYLHPGSTLELVEESELEFKVGDKVRVEGADYHSLGSDIGTIREISEHIRHTHSGRLIPTPYEVTTNTNLGQWVAPEHLELIEDEESEDSEIKIGDRVRLINADYPYKVNVSVGTEGTVTGRDFDGDYEVDFEYNYGTLNQTAGIDHIEKVPEESSEDSEIKAGDIVIATEDDVYGDITEGSEYEILEDGYGDLYFHDDVGDIRYVIVHEGKLRKKSAKRGFKKGDIVYVNEEITDDYGDTISSGIVTEFMESLIDRGVGNPNGINVIVGEDDLDKLTLVCRAEDRQDK